jgi:hypothetical protein
VKRVIGLLVIGAAMGFAEGRQTGRAASWPLALHALATPAAPGSGQPQLTASDRGVLLSWVERVGATATLKFAERNAGGWTAPVTVASGNDWFVNWADVPSVLRLGDGVLAAHWLQKSGPGTYAYDVRLAVSRDDGRTWTKPFSPHRDRTATEHGFVSLVRMAGAGLGVLWLDGRAMAPGPPGHDGGAMSLRFATFDRTLRQTADLLVDERVCECCPTAAVATSEGLIAAYRNRGEDELRDIHVARFVGGTWARSTPLHHDNWRVAACPVNGPALSASGRTVAAAWWTVIRDVGHAFLAFSDDAGRSWGDPVRLDDAQSTGRVDVELLPDGAAIALYLEPGDGAAHLRIRRVTRAAGASNAQTIASVDPGRSSGYPRIARHGNELVLAWIEGGRIRTAAAPLTNTE